MYDLECIIYECFVSFELFCLPDVPCLQDIDVPPELLPVEPLWSCTDTPRVYRPKY